jgi:hypothetical protein
MALERWMDEGNELTYTEAHADKGFEYYKGLCGSSDERQKTIRKLLNYKSWSVVFRVHAVTCR